MPPRARHRRVHWNAHGTGRSTLAHHGRKDVEDGMVLGIIGERSVMFPGTFVKAKPGIWCHLFPSDIPGHSPPFGELSCVGGIIIAIAERHRYVDGDASVDRRVL